MNQQDRNRQKAARDAEGIMRIVGRFIPEDRKQEAYDALREELHLALDAGQPSITYEQNVTPKEG